MQQPLFNTTAALLSSAVSLGASAALLACDSSGTAAFADAAIDAAPRTPDVWGIASPAVEPSPARDSFSGNLSANPARSAAAGLPLPSLATGAFEVYIPTPIPTARFQWGQAWNDSPGSISGTDTEQPAPLNGPKPQPAAPKPEIYTMLLAGLGVLGFLGKRRRA